MLEKRNLPVPCDFRNINFTLKYTLTGHDEKYSKFILLGIGTQNLAPNFYRLFLFENTKKHVSYVFDLFCEMKPRLKYRLEIDHVTFEEESGILMYELNDVDLL